jgi:N utilization substance protein B
MTHQRTRAREAALQLLFQHDLNPSVAREDVLRFTREQLGDAELEALALSLYEGTRGQLADIDARLSRAAENWRLERMAVIDRNILRLGAHELDRGEAPASVVLNEAIELARRFGSADSPAFVNGVLDRLNKERKPPLSPGTPGEGSGGEGGAAHPSEDPSPPAPLP